MITLFTAATGNGYRVSILLEEMGLPYTAQAIGFGPGAARPPAFLAASPLGKIPAIVDDDGPDGQSVVVAESLAIAAYLVEKTGALRPATAQARARAWEWCAIVATGFGGAFIGIFFARQLDEAAHGKVIAKHFEEVDRCFASMNARLAESAYLADDTYSFADAFAAQVILTARAFQVDLTRFPHVERWSEAVFARPAVQRGIAVKG